MSVFDKIKDFFKISSSETVEDTNNPNDTFLNIFESDSPQGNKFISSKKELSPIEQEEKILQELANSTSNPRLQGIAQLILSCDNIVNLLDLQGKPIDYASNPLISQLMQEKFGVMPVIVLNNQPAKREEENTKIEANSNQTSVSAINSSNSYAEVVVQQTLEKRLRIVIKKINTENTSEKIGILQKTLSLLIKPRPSLHWENILKDEKTLFTLMKNLPNTQFKELMTTPEFINELNKLLPNVYKKLRNKIIKYKFRFKLRSKPKQRQTPVSGEQGTLLYNYWEVLKINDSELLRKERERFLKVFRRIQYLQLETYQASLKSIGDQWPSPLVDLTSTARDDNNRQPLPSNNDDPKNIEDKSILNAMSTRRRPGYTPKPKPPGY